MREIVTVLGQLDKPVDVDIPKDIVRLSFRLNGCEMLNFFYLGYNDNVPVQDGLPFFCCIRPSGDDECAG